jgi:ATP-binding cassette subfamily B protein
VSFQYPGSDRKAIDSISLTVRPGEVVALVGENGSGKTTLIKLLCRLYDPASGSIRIDGTEICQYDPASLRGQISVVFQDYVAYHLTARENIWLGSPELPADDERIMDAARRSGADDVIRRLAQGYDTMLGKWIEPGEELSVGEWQKVALARAFLRDAQILVLDEPTSGMDARAEYELFDRFRHLIRGRTAILISHRLSSVRMADRIYVLDRGQVVECGTHDELVDARGTYARLFEMQAHSYR